MKIALLSSLVTVFAGLVACGSAADPNVGQTSQGVSRATVSVDPLCPVGKKVCEVEKKDGKCGYDCVIDTALCVAPPKCEHIVCDPDGPQPRPGCAWDESTCAWECPVCDPDGPEPRPGCSWDEATCAWSCPVCDPAGSPPEPTCKWDPTACVWLCL
jgi:hypothetical protein